MKKLLFAIFIIITLVILDRWHSIGTQSTDASHKIAVITTSDTTFSREVEVTYPENVGERPYTAQEINGKKAIATVEINGKLKEKEKCTNLRTYSSPKVTYLLFEDHSMVVCKEANIIAPITEETARALLAN